MSERASFQRQIEELDRRIRELDDRFDERETLSIRPQVWLAKTIGKTVSEAEGAEKEYPSGASSTFGVQFRRPKFEEKVGSQELEGPFGDDEPQRLSLTVPKRFIAEGTDTFVVEIDGRFYFLNSGREVLIVELDEDLDEAIIISTGSSSPLQPNTDCVRPTQSPATAWGFTDAGILCPTASRLDAPEGVYNFQTDKVHKAKKTNGDPNLMVVYREAESGRWVPECSTCDAPATVPTSPCDCLSDENLCFVYIHFREVGIVGIDEEISGQVWPDYCNWVAPPNVGFVPPCTSCELWNRPSGWSLVKEVGATMDDCRHGILALGSTLREPFPATETFPCMTPEGGDATSIIAVLSCPSPTDTTGQATIDVRVKGCLLFTLNFDDIIYSDDEYQEDTNRVTRITIPGIQGNRCICLVDTTRNDLFQGNFNADTGTPNLQNGVSAERGGPTENVPGHNYVVNVAGTHDFGDGGIVLAVNDLVVFDDLIDQWVVIPKKAGGAVDNETFAPIEIVRFIDSDGCHWSNTMKNGRMNLTFALCPP